MKDHNQITMIKFCFYSMNWNKDTIINSLLNQLLLEKKVNINKIYNKQRIDSQYTSEEGNIEIFKMPNDISSKIV